MPAFGKARRIASHVKNSKFAGTDFSYEDMEAKRYSDRYVPEVLRTEGDAYVLQLMPNKDLKTDYSKLIVWVRGDNFYPFKIEFYDKGNKLYKTMASEQIERMQGYWISKSYEMKDVKANHTTRIILVNAKFDTGVSDDKFTERYLSR
jgi:outer membrane lipoprotein-sorting protein